MLWNRQTPDGTLIRAVLQGQTQRFAGLVNAESVKRRLRKARERLKEWLEERRVRQVVREQRLGKDFRKRVMAGLPLMGLTWQAGQMLLPWAWMGLGALLVGLELLVETE